MADEPGRAGAPRVSVVIPSRNRVGLLPRAVASVLAQTRSDFEIVVVVDGSTDGTVDWLEAVADERVRWLARPHEGQAAARHAGCQAARGDWIAFLDDDNEWLPTYLESQLAVAARAPVDVVACRAYNDLPDGTVATQDRPRDPDPLRNACRGGGYPLISCVLVRRETVHAVGGFDTDLTQSVDVHLILRLALRARWARNDEVLMIRHNDAPSQVSRNRAGYRRALWALDREFGAEIRRRAGMAEYLRWFRWHPGQAAVLTMYDEAPTLGRRAGWNALATLVPALPWSARSLSRPLAILTLGPRKAAQLRDRYHAAHHAVAHRHRA